MRKQNKKAIQLWLLSLIFISVVQVLLGGITRLTESGLSITRWEVVTGSIPPISQADWVQEYEAYKQTPQYEKINQGMTLGQFKRIFFWEYFHRLWGRLIGVFLFVPLVWFVFKKQIRGNFIVKIAIAILWLGVVGGFGWIMVASGLVNRPWVNAYKLTIHFLLALSFISYLLWLFIDYRYEKVKFFLNKKELGFWLIALGVSLLLQLALGGLMSGMKAALAYPTWPKMNGEWLPNIISIKELTKNHLIHYDKNPYVVSFVQFSHRMLAYFTYALGVFASFTWLNNNRTNGLNKYVWFFLFMLHLQIILGIITVINSIGKVPVWLGVMHQAGALFLSISFVLMILFFSKAHSTRR